MIEIEAKEEDRLMSRVWSRRWAVPVCRWCGRCPLIGHHLWWQGSRCAGKAEMFLCSRRGTRRRAWGEGSSWVRRAGTETSLRWPPGRERQHHGHRVKGLLSCRGAELEICGKTVDSWRCQKEAQRCKDQRSTRTSLIPHHQMMRTLNKTELIDWIEDVFLILLVHFSAPRLQWLHLWYVTIFLNLTFAFDALACGLCALNKNCPAEGQVVFPLELWNSRTRWEKSFL